MLSKIQYNNNYFRKYVYFFPDSIEVTMAITSVTTMSELRKFIYLPYSIYKNDKNWIIPLISEQKKLFKQKKNPVLNHCSFQLFLAKKENRPCGRIMAFVDHLSNKHWKNKTGFFGAYECEDSSETSKELLNAAKEWLKEQGMDRMRGPINLTSQEWGFIVEGFNEPATIMSPYNPPCYNQHVKDFGMQKTKDLLVYSANGADYQIPDRFLAYSEKLIKKYNINIRSLNMKQLKEDVQTIVNLANRSFVETWGYVPVTEAESNAITRDLKMIVDPEIIFIAESEGQPIGFSITLPDINVILRKMKGKLFPFGIFRLLYGIPRIRDYRIWALGIVKPYQRKGIDTLLYQKNYEKLKPKANKVEANYVLEDNYSIRNAVEKSGFSHLKTYRVYEMSLNLP